MQSRAMISLILCLCSVAYACSGPSTDATKPGNSSAVPATSSSSAVPVASSSAVPSPGQSIEWISQQIPAVMEAGKEEKIALTFKNVSDTPWRYEGAGTIPDPKAVRLSYHWYSAPGDKAVIWDGTRTPLPREIAPGETVTLNNVRVLPPPNPGQYQLKFSLLQESIGWFDSKGGNTLVTLVTVR